jgi:hypothetical protein
MWEYDYVYVTDCEDLDNVTLRMLNDAGKQGWEFTGNERDTGYGTLYLMKRSISQKVDAL